MFQFGFELEGFYRNPTNGLIDLPPKDWPTDGFPGLCEVRTSGGNHLHQAYTQLMGEYIRYPFDYEVTEFTFTPEQKRLIRARHSEKQAVEIVNVYGKPPKALGNRTLASLQLNISWQTRAAYHDDKGIFHPAQYGIFDYLPIIKRLDKTFKEQIEADGRQIGWYAVKGTRVEYRSLSNKMFSLSPHRVNDLLARITRSLNS